MLFIDDAHDLHPKTLTALKRLIELVAEGGGQLSIVLVGHPKLKNDLRRPKMEEVGDRTTVFEFGGLRDPQRDYIDWVMKASLEEGVAQGDVLTDEAATLLAAKLKTPLQIGQHLVIDARCRHQRHRLGPRPFALREVERGQAGDGDFKVVAAGFLVRHGKKRRRRALFFTIVRR